MSEEEIPLSQHDQLAMAIAQGKSIAGWARQNGVPRRTAQRWATEPDVRRQVEDWRRRVLDRALGYMAGRSMWAVRGITELGEKAESESVQLRLSDTQVLHDTREFTAPHGAAFFPVFHWVLDTAGSSDTLVHYYRCGHVPGSECRGPFQE
jgi:hypothetical protein